MIVSPSARRMGSLFYKPYPRPLFLRPPNAAVTVFVLLPAFPFLKQLPMRLAFKAAT